MAKRRRRKSTVRSKKGRFVKRARKVRAKRVSRRRRSAGKRTPATGYTIGTKRIRRRKLNPRVRRRRRSNPRLFGLPSMGGIIGQLTNAGLAATGALGFNLAFSYIPVPESLKGGWLGRGVKLAGAIGFGMLAKRFLGAKGNVIAQGALIGQMIDIGRVVISGVSPDIGARLGEFEDVSLGDDIDYIDPASPINGYLSGPANDGSTDENGMGQYLNGDLDGMAGDLDGRYEEIMV